MADKKISQLTAATTPLAGTEVLPIVQSGSTVKTPVSTLLDGLSNTGSGNNVRATDPTFTSRIGVGMVPFGFESYDPSIQATPPSSLNIAATQNQLVVGSGYYQKNDFNSYYSTTGQKAARFVCSAAAGAATIQVTNTTGTVNNTITWTDALTIGSTGNVTANSGNFVVGTSGKGIDFSATASGSGTMTSELLADYEEGDWTPVLSDAGSTSGTWDTTLTGRYTKIGRMVTCIMVITGTGMKFASSADYRSYSGLPYTPAFYGSGSFSGSTIEVCGNTFIATNNTVWLIGANSTTTANGLYLTFSYQT